MITETDKKFLMLARSVAGIFSKDPSTKVGAVAVGAMRNQVAFGYNGLPPGLADIPERLENREAKLSLTLHAEENALANATFPVETLYVTHHPCEACALRILARRTVKRVVFCIDDPFDFRWGDQSIKAGRVFLEAGVEIYGVAL